MDLCTLEGAAHRTANSRHTRRTIRSLYCAIVEFVDRLLPESVPAHQDGRCGGKEQCTVSGMKKSFCWKNCLFCSCRSMVAQCKQCESFICQSLVEQKQEERKNLKYVDASVHEHMSACEHCGGRMTVHCFCNVFHLSATCLADRRSCVVGSPLRWRLCARTD